MCNAFLGTYFKSSDNIKKLMIPVAHKNHGTGLTTFTDIEKHFKQLLRWGTFQMFFSQCPILAVLQIAKQDLEQQ